MAINKSYSTKEFFSAFNKVRFGTAKNAQGEEFTAIRCYKTGEPRFTPVSISNKVKYNNANDLMAQGDQLQVVEATNEETGNTFFSLCPLNDFSNWGEELSF